VVGGFPVIREKARAVSNAQPASAIMEPEKNEGGEGLVEAKFG
jgi:hypothetical protein